MAVTAAQRTCYKAESGQVLPIALLGVVISSAVLVLLFNNAQRIIARSQLVNAADAAAYSGAVWIARHLNFVAYTNRAMIANHAAVGHFVSYVSWVRYVHDSIEDVDRVTQWLPFVAPYIDSAERIAAHVRQLAEQSASVVVPAIDAWNASFRAAQAEVQASLAADHLRELMQATASAYDPGIRLNDHASLARMPGELRAMLESQLLEQLASVPSFVRRYTVSDDRDSVRELIEKSLRATPSMMRWISGERGWQESNPVFRLRKRGVTEHVQLANGADWRARDQLQYRTRRLVGWGGWGRIGAREGQASAREFASGYAGVSSYYNVAGTPSDRALSLVAIATKSQDEIASADLLGMTSSTLPLLSALAVARVEFRRPAGDSFAALARGEHELANLFNPFRAARLARSSCDVPMRRPPLQQTSSARRRDCRNARRAHRAPAIRHRPALGRKAGRHQA